MDLSRQQADELYVNKKYEEAAKAYKKLLNQSDEQDVELYARLAISQRMINSLEESEKTLKLGILKFPNSNWLYIESAALENKRKNFKNAVTLWKKAKELSKKFSELDYKRYSYALNELGLKGEAISILEEGLMLYPHSKILLNLRYSYASLKIAIQFYGHSRSFMDTFEYLKKNLIDFNKKYGVVFDIFIHTWDEKEHSIVKPHYKKDYTIAGVKLSKEEITFLEKMYRPKGIKIEAQLSLDDNQIRYINSKGYTNEQYNIIYNISYTMQEVNNLRKEYCQKLSITYDYVILTRLDILFKEPFDFSSIVYKKIKPFMDFSEKEIEKAVFYSYMDTNDLYRNQKKYITGIDLLALSKPNVMDTICSWHKNILNNPPKGTENAITTILAENNIDYHLLYYQKPQKWTILRTNDKDISLSPHIKKISKYKKLWEWESVINEYEQALKSDNSLLYEYIIFLCDIGKINKVYKVINHYGIDYIKNLPFEEFKNNVLHVLNLIVKDYIPILYGTIEKKSMEQELIDIILHQNPEALLYYLEKNEQIFKIDNGRTQMYLNFALNKLLDNNLFTSNIAKYIIELYLTSTAINKTRKKFVISRIVDYFNSNNSFDFFKFLNDGTILHKITSIIHRFGDNEEGAKIYLRKINNKIKYNSVNYNKKIKNPKIAIAMSGKIRGDFYSVIKTIEKSILSHIDADIFIHTWDQADSWMGMGGDINWVYRLFGNNLVSICPQELRTIPFFKQNFPHVYQKLLEPVSFKIDEKYLKSIFDFKNITIENESQFISTLSPNKDSFKSRGNFNQAKMLYGIFKVHQDIIKYEYKYNIQYDYIIRVRPDIGLNGTISSSDFDSLENDQILVDFYPYGPQDQFRAGNRNVMILLADLWKECFNKGRLSPFIEYPKIDSHNLTYLWMIENNIITAPTKITRDVSLAARNSIIPDFSVEFKKDLEQLSIQYSLKKKEYEKFFTEILNKIKK